MIKSTVISKGEDLLKLTVQYVYFRTIIICLFISIFLLSNQSHVYIRIFIYLYMREENVKYFTRRQYHTCRMNSDETRLVERVLCYSAFVTTDRRTDFTASMENFSFELKRNDRHSGESLPAHFKWTFRDFSSLSILRLNGQPVDTPRYHGVRDVILFLLAFSKKGKIPVAIRSFTCFRETVPLEYHVKELRNPCFTVSSHEILFRFEWESSRNKKREAYLKFYGTRISLFTY